MSVTTLVEDGSGRPPLNRCYKTVEFDGEAGNGQVGEVAIFDVTPPVFVEELVAYCSDDLAVSSGTGTASIQLGYTGATNGLIATTPVADIDAGDIWVDATPDAGKVAIPSGLKEFVLSKDIVAEVTNTHSVDAEVSTLTFPSKAGATSGDYIVISSQSGLTFAIALDKTLAAEVARLTFPAVAGATAGDYFVITAQDGVTYAASLNKTGADPEPTGAAWVAIAGARKVHVDISGGTDAASVAALVETAIDALTGFTAKIVTDDTAADGTMLFTQQVRGAVANPVPHNADDSGAGSITVAITTPGADAVTPSGALYTAVASGRKAVADITGDTTAAQVAARAETALNLLTGFTALILTDDTAADGTMTLTQTATGDCTNPVPKNADDSGAGSITFVETNPGTSLASLTKPTGGSLLFCITWRPLGPDGNVSAA